MINILKNTRIRPAAPGPVRERAGHLGRGSGRATSGAGSGPGRVVRPRAVRPGRAGRAGRPGRSSPYTPFL